jgi:K+-transporting ATPase ATPase B chain
MPISITVIVALLVCLIPTTIGGLLSAIGIAGMDRMIQANVIAMSGRAVEAAGDVDVLLLDKTGTITLGNRQAVELLPAPGVTVPDLALPSSASLSTPSWPNGLPTMTRSPAEARRRYPTPRLSLSFDRLTADHGALGVQPDDPQRLLDPEQRHAACTHSGARGPSNASGVQAAHHPHPARR